MLLLILILLLIIKNSNSYNNNIYSKRCITMNSDNSDVIFGGVKFASPLSNHLKRLGITSALPIQEAAIRY